MTDQERLEEIIKQRQKKSNALDYIDLDIDWLIEQAKQVFLLKQRNKRISETVLEQIDVTQARNERLEKRIEELEGAIKGAHDIAKIQSAHIEELESRLEIMGTTLDQEVVVGQRYKRALEFYADKGNYDWYKETGSFKRIEKDNGEIARKALEVNYESK